VKDKTDQIVDAAITIFVNKGFIQATTQEIAKVANVAEVTLYRKFQTKQKLFEYVVNKVLEDNFLTEIQEYSYSDDAHQFFNKIFMNRLNAISKNMQFVRLLIAEGLMKNLAVEIDFTTLILNHLKNAINLHFSKHQLTVDAEFLAKQCLSILLGHAILPSTTPFYKLEENEKQKLIQTYTTSLLINLN